MKDEPIRIKAAVLYAPRHDRLTPVLRFVDPQLPDDDAEFFTIDAKHVDQLIADLRRCATDAVQRAEELGRGSPEERALLAQRVGGRA